MPITTPDPASCPDRWPTLPHSHLVLAIAHNVTAATRLFDVLPLLAEDPRMRIVFTIPGSSEFDSDADEFLASRGVRRIPWDEALSTPFDLAIAASYGGDLHAIQAPLLTIPHGMGYNKFLETGNRKPETGNRKPVFGLSPEWLLHADRVVPAVAVLSHHEQRERLRAACPEAVPHAVVAGDICLDRLTASLPLRPSYRQAFGASPRQVLVVVSTTWGPDSLLGRRPSLVRELAVRLPVDEFRVIAALHPNISSWHSRWQVREWLADCARAGVLVTEDVDQWRAAVVAADVVIGDHGSVPFYAAALGVAVLMPGSAEEAVDPGSPIARLMAAVPRLSLAGDLPGTLHAAVRDHDPRRSATITGLATSEPGRAAEILRRVLYGLLDVAEPAEPAETTVLPLPVAEAAPARAHLVQSELDGHGTWRVRRYPAERLRVDQRPPRGWHLVVGAGELRRRWLELADVVVGPRGDDLDQWIADTLARLPGCLLAAAPADEHRWLLGDRAGELLEVDAGPVAGRLFASMAYRWRTQHPSLAGLAGTHTVTAGENTYDIRVRAG